MFLDYPTIELWVTVIFLGNTKSVSLRHKKYLQNCTFVQENTQMYKKWTKNELATILALVEWLTEQ